MQILKKILEDQPKYRYDQVKRAIFQSLISSWDQAQGLPKDLRVKLSKKLPLDISGRLVSSKDGQTQKALIRLKDENQVEAVLMKYPTGRATVCLSSQVGCSLGCKFCATGRMGLTRDLSAWEILAQALFFSRQLEKTNQRISNVVFMGMGEPFLNFDNVWQAVEILNDPKAFEVGARHISISTAGIPEGILKLAKKDLQVNLALSLHAPNDSLRQKLMPISEKYSLKEVFQAVDFYIKKTNRKVMIEYLMIKGVNDGLVQAEKLASLLKDRLVMVNLIKYNPTPNDSFYSSDQEQIEEFKKTLEKKGIEATQRYSFGQDINAACGQLKTLTTI